MADFAHTMPAELRAGDSIDWTASAPDYTDADGWALSYVLLSVSARVTIDATADGDGWAVAIPAAESGTLAAGVWRWSVHAANGDDRATIMAGTVKVLADPLGAAAADGLDLRSWAEQQLALVEAALAGTLTSAQESKQVSTSAGTVAIKYVPRGDLVVLRSQLKDEVAGEDAARRIANGEPPARRIVARIRR